MSPIHSVAVADEPHREVGDRSRNGWEERPFGVDLRLGIATPTGAIGVGFDYSPLPPLSIECAVGTNFIGPEIACGARARLFLGRGFRSLYLGASASGGPHEQTAVTRYGAPALFLAPMSAMGHSTHSSYEFDIAYWANVELGYESRRGAGSTFRGYGGMSFLLNPADARLRSVTEDDVVLPVTTAMLYGGVAFGYAL